MLSIKLENLQNRLSTVSSRTIGGSDLNIMSCLPDKELELYGCTVPELGMELCVRDTGPGEYFIQVRICHKHTDIVMYSSAVIDICSL